MIFCTKVVQKVAKQMPVNLVQDDVKYQGKYVLCRDMHFGHITAGNYRRRFLSNSNWKNRQLKLAPGSKLVQKWVNKFRNLGTVDESKSPGVVNHQTTGHHRAGCRLRPAEPEKVHDLASGTGASAERLSKDHEGRLHIFYLHMNTYFFFMILRRVVLLTPDMPDAKWPFRALLDEGGNLLDCGGLVVRLTLVTYFYPLSPNYETC